MPILRFFSLSIIVGMVIAGMAVIADIMVIAAIAGITVIAVIMVGHIVIIAGIAIMVPRRLLSLVLLRGGNIGGPRHCGRKGVVREYLWSNSCTCPARFGDAVMH
ncbi:MAG: hypothetical protein ACYDGO_05125 [Smithellaceae bacterium]